LLFGTGLYSKNLPRLRCADRARASFRHEVWGGYNIYPTNVEAAIYSHPSVAEAIVIGVPDPYRGETVKAFVVLRGDATLTLEDLQAHLKDRLSPIEMPRQLEVREQLPKIRIWQAFAP